MVGLGVSKIWQAAWIPVGESLITADLSGRNICGGFNSLFADKPAPTEIASDRGNQAYRKSIVGANWSAKRATIKSLSSAGTISRH